MRVPTVPGVDRKDRAMMPIIVNACLLPGVGQLMQRRWLAGLLALAAILSAIAWLLHNMLTCVRAATGEAPDVNPLALGLSSAASVAAVLVCHLTIVFDSVRHLQRSRRSTPPPVPPRA